VRGVELEIDGTVARGILFDDKAPRTCAKVRALLPIEDRTIQVRWSGAAWRTEKNYPLELGEIENPVTVLTAGDLIYYDESRLGLYKIGVAYGRAAWRDFNGDLSVSHIGRLTENVAAFVKACDRILYDGPRVVRIRHEA
jgi:hypothetical protein